jgi:hypothetical protein
MKPTLSIQLSICIPTCPQKQIVFSTTDTYIKALASVFMNYFHPDFKYCYHDFSYQTIVNSPDALPLCEDFNEAAQIELIKNLLRFKQHFRPHFSEQFKFSDKTAEMSYALFSEKKGKIVGLYKDAKVSETALLCMKTLFDLDRYSVDRHYSGGDIRSGIRMFLHSSSGVKYWEGISSDEPKIPLSVVFRVEDCAKLLQEHNVAQFPEFDLSLYRP